MSPRFSWIGAWALMAAGAGSVAHAQAPAPKAATGVPARRPAQAAGVPKAVVDPAQARKVDDLLAEWEKRSAKIQMLDATFTRTDVKGGPFKGRTDYEGRALLKAPNLACLNLSKIDPENKAKTTFFQRIICTGDEVVQLDGETKTVTVFPLPKNEQQKALQEGPLPFLFDMKAAQVKERYIIELEQEGAKAYRLQIIPRQDIDRDAFSMARIDLNKATFLPDNLQLIDPNGKESQTYKFKDVSANKEIAVRNFQRGKPPAGWKVVMNPPPDQEAPAGARARDGAAAAAPEAAIQNSRRPKTR